MLKTIAQVHKGWTITAIYQTFSPMQEDFLDETGVKSVTGCRN